MKTTKLTKPARALVLITLASGMFAIGCELVVDFDRTKIPVTASDATTPDAATEGGSLTDATAPDASDAGDASDNDASDAGADASDADIGDAPNDG